MVFAGCALDVNPDSNNGMIYNIYEESDRAFPNPERGFYSAVDFYSATASSITPIKVKVNRNFNKTLFYTGYYLTDYMESDIAPEYLQLIRDNMRTLRDGGAKCVLRFAYKTDTCKRPRASMGSADQGAI